MTLDRAQVPGPMRVPPLVTDINRDFWTGGLVGELRIVRCQDCKLWLHPPTTLCRRCLSRNVAAETVSGKGTVGAFTINHQQWSPTATADPYVIAIVEFPEQPALRLTTNIVNCAPSEVYIGMPVHVVFEALADVALPLFAPDPDRSTNT